MKNGANQLYCKAVGEKLKKKIFELLVKKKKIQHIALKNQPYCNHQNVPTPFSLKLTLFQRQTKN